jgi:hypothetical protein
MKPCNLVAVVAIALISLHPVCALAKDLDDMSTEKIGNRYRTNNTIQATSSFFMVSGGVIMAPSLLVSGLAFASGRGNFTDCMGCPPRYPPIAWSALLIAGLAAPFTIAGTTGFFVSRHHKHRLRRELVDRDALSETVSSRSDQPIFKLAIVPVPSGGISGTLRITFYLTQSPSYSGIGARHLI